MGNTDESDMMRANEANWDARAALHVNSDFYHLDTVRDGRNDLGPAEQAALGDLHGKDVVHLQCHLGSDTVSLARLGARATGLDISGESVRHARQLALDCGLDVEYVQANVYDAVEALGAERFDVVYTGKGALCWLPDLDRWARVVADLLRPGGRLYLVEFHPMMGSAADDQPELSDGVLRFDYPYSSQGRHFRSDDAETYTDGGRLTGATVNYQWSHGLGDVVTALAGAGLAVTALQEHNTSPWRRWPDMVRAEDGWRFPGDLPWLPLLFSVQATKR